MDRVAVALERLRVLRAEADEASAFPCYSCAYYSLGCEHPAVAEVLVDPIKGGGKVVPVPANEARSPSGKCGPEGALWLEMEPRQAMLRGVASWMDAHPTISTVGILFTAAMILEALF